MNVDSEDRELLREAVVDLHRAQQRERRFREHADVMVRALHALSLGDEEPAIHGLLSVVGEALGAHEAVLLVQEARGLRPLAAADPSRHTAWQAGEPFARALAGARVNIADTRWVPELAHHPLVRSGELRSMLLAGFPTGDANGCLLLCSDQPRAFGPDEQELVAKLIPVATEAMLRLRARERGRALHRRTEEQNASLQREISERLLAERRLREAQAGLIQAEKLSSLGRMVSGIAHELRNPTNYIANNVSTAQRRTERVRSSLLDMLDPSDPESEAIAKWMDDEFSTLLSALAHSADGAKRVQAIVDALGNFSRIDEADQKPVRLRTVVEDVIRILETKWRGLDIEVEVGSDVVVMGQPVKLAQLVMNLVDNAVFAAIEAQGEANARVGVRVSVADAVELRVWDNGHGVPPDLVERVFDPFVTTKPIGVGTGMGLAICWGIAMEHGGMIQYDADAGQSGATFLLTLPLPTLSALQHVVEGSE